MFKRSSSSNQKILLSCMLTGLIVALLVSTLQFFVTWHKRDIKYDTLLSDIQNYVSSYFADLKSGDLCLILIDQVDKALAHIAKRVAEA